MRRRRGWDSRHRSILINSISTARLGNKKTNWNIEYTPFFRLRRIKQLSSSPSSSLSSSASSPLSAIHPLSIHYLTSLQYCTHRPPHHTRPSPSPSQISSANAIQTSPQQRINAHEAAHRSFTLPPHPTVPITPESPSANPKIAHRTSIKTTASTPSRHHPSEHPEHPESPDAHTPAVLEGTTDERTTCPRTPTRALACAFCNPEIQPHQSLAGLTSSGVAQHSPLARSPTMAAVPET